MRHSGNAFLDAVLGAYNNHEDLVLSPDDIWMLICLQFSKHVDENAEQLRDLFVEHQGQKQLEVITFNETKEEEWNEFFELIHDRIKQNVKGDVVETLQCNFSTSGNVEKMLSTLAIMSTFKKFFSYSRCIPLCGISKVHFLGSLDDWTNLKEKLLALRNYAIPRSSAGIEEKEGETSDRGCAYEAKDKAKDGTAGCAWSHYIDSVAPIVDKLIDTYRGEPDVEWWNKIVNLRNGRLGSGSTSYISGWVLLLFNIHRDEVETAHVNALHFEVPVHVTNHLTGTKKTVQLIGGFYGVHKTADNAHRPVMSMIVYHDGNEEKMS